MIHQLALVGTRGIRVVTRIELARHPGLVLGYEPLSEMVGRRKRGDDSGRSEHVSDRLHTYLSCARWQNTGEETYLGKVYRPRAVVFEEQDDNESEHGFAVHSEDGVSYSQDSPAVLEGRDLGERGEFHRKGE